MRLNIGAGPIQPADWSNVDPDPQWGVLPWPARWARARFEGAVANHVLQLVAWPDLVPWLVVARDVLEPGGWLRLLVPDFPGAYAAALEGNRDWFPIAAEHEPSIDGALCLYLAQAGATRSVFTGPWLCDLMRRAGFVAVHQPRFGETAGPGWLTDLDTREHESIIVEGKRL